MSRGIVMALCVSSVPLMVAFLIWWMFGAPLTAFRPYINDEVTYWHQALTFSQLRFGGGLYTTQEIINPSGFTPFGAHGPGFPVLYGLFGTAFGWHLYSPVIANLVLISLATWLCVSIARLGHAKALLLTLLLVTFWPLLIWTPTAMQEGLHYAGAIALAGCVAGALAPTPSQTARIVGWPLLALLGFVRPSWLILLPVWALAVTWRRRPLWIFTAVAASLAMALLVLAAYTRSTAPYQNGFFFLRAAAGTVDLTSLWANLTANLQLTAAVSEYESYELLLRAQYWGWVAAAALMIGAAITRRVRDEEPGVPYLLAGAGAMAGSLALMLLLYTLKNAAEHRVLSAFLLFAAVLAVTAPGRIATALVAMLIASNLAYSPPLLHALKEERQDNFVWDHRGHRQLEASLTRGGIVFRPGELRWCNTLLTSQFPPFLTTVPPGIGLSVVREPDQLELPAKSRYLLLDERALAALRTPPHTQALATLPYGTLYLNLDAECR